METDDVNAVHCVGQPVAVLIEMGSPRVGRVRLGAVIVTKGSYSSEKSIALDMLHKTPFNCV